MANSPKSQLQLTTMTTKGFTLPKSIRKTTNMIPATIASSSANNMRTNNSYNKLLHKPTITLKTNSDKIQQTKLQQKMQNEHDKMTQHKPIVKNDETILTTTTTTTFEAPQIGNNNTDNNVALNNTDISSATSDNNISINSQTNSINANQNVVEIKSEPKESDGQLQLQPQQQEQQQAQTKAEQARTNEGTPAKSTSNEIQPETTPRPSYGLVTTRPNPVPLNVVNPNITCNLCKGYLIDATTIVECLHSFCHSCLIKHLRVKQYCPQCEMMINTAKPNIRSDTTLQAIVYKLVPSLYERELMRRRAFYKDIPEQAAFATPEQRGDDTEHLIFSPSEYMSLSLEYADIAELADAGAEYGELLKPRYLQCPAMYTVGHLKKFVFGKFEIDVERFGIDIMYKVKTIVLLDHYTLMDVAYIYTWKRDAPMRFYFRVNESLQPVIRPRRRVPIPTVAQNVPKAEILLKDSQTESENNELPILGSTEIKTEKDSADEFEEFQVIPKAIKTGSAEKPMEPLKIIIVNKNHKEKQLNGESKSPSTPKTHKEKKHTNVITESPKEERKVDNIKLKIDRTNQNSVTIINMSDPERKEIVKPIRPEKESKTKNKRDRDGSSPKSHSSERKQKAPSPLTVPPLTIKTERITSPHTIGAASPKVISPNVNAPTTNDVEEQKSEFLKSFALTPIKLVTAEKQQTTPPKITTDSSSSNNSNANDKLLMKPPISFAPKSAVASKRKSKEPVKAIAKKPKTSPPLPSEDFKIKLPPSSNVGASSADAAPQKSNNVIEKPLMPPPAKPPIAPIFRKGQNKYSPPPLHQGIQMAPPGNRTPIAKRYQPILPKSARPNPFANLSTAITKANKNWGTEFKSVESEVMSAPVYGPTAKEPTKMGPPPPLSAIGGQKPTNVRGSNRNTTDLTPTKPGSGNKITNYLNYALFNSTKSKGKEAPPGCRTPMYTPNSPIYSPSSPQYVPNYNIPTMPTYKYTPKPTNGNNFLQNMLGGNNAMSSLFPAPPTKKDTVPANQNPNNSSKTNDGTNKHYPFPRSLSPIEDGAEKQQVKVKSLLNSCNINIPASLSITLTREDKETSSNNATHPKHKSPVNNYIEIVKLPDQTPDKNDTNRRPSPPGNNQAHLTTMQPPPPTAPSAMNQPTANTSHKTIPSPQHLIMRPLPKTGPPTNTNGFNTMSPAGNELKTNSTTSPPKTSPTLPNMNSIAPVKPVLTPPHADKKTPSPEKRPAAQLATVGHSSPTATENKSPKSANGADANANSSQAAKKFRPILPRQNPTSNAETMTTAKPTNSVQNNVIGTYSSPSGVSVKVHGNKKVAPPKKSPGSAQAQQKQRAPPRANNNSTNALLSQISPPLKTTSPKSPTIGLVRGTNTPPPPSPMPMPSPQAAAAFNKLMPPSALAAAAAAAGLPHLPPTHAMQAIASAAGLSNISTPMGIASSANQANQAEFNKLLKDNLLRAQVAQAAQANQSNFIYMQAYLMEHLSRMQRTEAFNDYMQKRKGAGNPDGIKPGENEQLTMPPLKLENVSANRPKTSPQPVVGVSTMHSANSAAKKSKNK